MRRRQHFFIHEADTPEPLELTIHRTLRFSEVDALAIAWHGNYLRFFWLCEEGEYARVLKEMLEYFATMARETGTLWEHDSPAASCNHGFASVAAMLVLRCTVGFDTVKNGRVVYLQNTPNETYNVNVEFKKKEK